MRLGRLVIALYLGISSLSAFSKAEADDGVMRIYMNAMNFTIDGKDVRFYEEIAKRLCP